MKVAVVYNRDSKSVINVLGAQNREKYGAKNIKRIVDALREGDHQVIALEGDKDLVDRLEEFMPRVLKGERPGMVFNLAYGIQGSARYTHVPGILEMVGMPYVGSGPLAHSLALDKVVAKMIFRQQNIPTPDFAVLDSTDFEMPAMEFPLIVKPKNEAVSLGLKVVHSESELRDAAKVIFDTFLQAVLVEQYIEGREINVGILGNHPTEALPPIELDFGEGPRVYTLEDKKHTSGREVALVCPAPIGPELTARAQEIAKRVFSALGCFDCARVDMRLDAEDRLWVLEVNSLPSLGQSGSYVAAAAAAGLDFPALVNRLVQIASARYFSTPKPPLLGGTSSADVPEQIFGFLTERRDRMERRIEEWVNLTSRTSDPVGIQGVTRKMNGIMTDIAMRPVESLTNSKSVWTWETEKGHQDGTLLIAHVDVPLADDVPSQGFRRDPEYLYGEGIGCSRAPLVMLEYALRSLRHVRRLRHTKVGVLYCSDEGLECRYSAEVIRAAAAKAARVLVLRPGNTGDKIIGQRRGHRNYKIVAECKPQRIGKGGPKSEVLLWIASRLLELSQLSNRHKQVAVSAVDLQTKAFALHAPHRVLLSLRITYGDPTVIAELEQKLHELLESDAFTCRVEMVADRPPMRDHKGNKPLQERLSFLASQLEIPLDVESSVWPSAAGLVPLDVPVVCGVAPVATDLYTPREAVQRLSVVQRTLLLAQLLGQEAKK